MRFYIFFLNLLVSGYCPYQDNCNLNLHPSQTYFNAHDVIDVNWDTSNFIIDNIWIKLMTKKNDEIESNCFFGYVDLLRADETTILNMEIPNSGNFKWNVENLNYDNSDLNIILISDSFINCGIDSRIEQTHLISSSFKLFPIDTQFNWIWPNKDFTIVNPGGIYNIIADGFYHQDRVAYKLNILASINNFINNTWIQRNYDDLSTQELLSRPNWIDFNFYLNNANSTHNHNSHYNISYNWLVPSDLRALMKSNGIVYSVARENGNIVYLNDSDVSMRFTLSMVTYSRNETGHITGFKNNCFDTNNNNNCDEDEYYTHYSNSFIIREATSNPTTPFLTFSPSFTPTISPTESPTFSPTISPTNSPTISPTNSPTISPSESPTTSPTNSPTTSPTNSPTESPTKSPTISPSSSPTISPTFSPTINPSSSPTKSPTKSPTISPSSSPTESPTQSPTISPSSSPTKSPTKSPTENPTFSPTISPTKSPTTIPTKYPTTGPTKSPTTIPTKYPTISPTKNNISTFAPTIAPSNYSDIQNLEKDVGDDGSNIWILWVLLAIIFIIILFNVIKKNLRPEKKRVFIQKDNPISPVYKITNRTDLQNRVTQNQAYENIIRPKYQGQFIDQSDHVYNNLKKQKREIGSIQNTTYQSTKPILKTNKEENVYLNVQQHDLILEQDTINVEQNNINVEQNNINVEQNNINVEQDNLYDIPLPNLHI